MLASLDTGQGLLFIIGPEAQCPVAAEICPNCPRKPRVGRPEQTAGILR